MTGQSFTTRRTAALALLSAAPDLERRVAQFLGTMCVEKAPSDRQDRWLHALLRENGLPPLEISQ